MRTMTRADATAAGAGFTAACQALYHRASDDRRKAALAQLKRHVGRG